MSEYDFNDPKERHRFYKSSAWSGVNGLRQQAIEKDNGECVWCKEEGKVTTSDHAILEVDHVYEIENHPDRAYDLDSLRTLCKYHHNKRHNRFQFIIKKNKWQDERW